MNKHKIFIGITVLEIALLAVFFLLGQQYVRTVGQHEINGKRQLVGSLGLTDFSIWTEARYTRHPSQTDFFTPFQDFPSSLEHFPAGSIMAPPQREVALESNPLETRKGKP